MKHDPHRTPEEIEDHIALTRGRIDGTLRAIEQRLTTDQLVHQGVDYLRNSGATEFAMNLGGSVKHHPLPVSLVAVGLAWLMTVERSDRRVADAPGNGADAVAAHAGSGEKVEELKSKAASARHRISNATHTVRDQASRIGEGARGQWDKARGGYDNVMREQPLALGAIGFGIGAACAALLPRTRREDAMMGAAGDRVAERAQAAGSERLDDVRRVGNAAAQAAREEPHRARSSGAQTGPQAGRLQGSTAGGGYVRNERADPAPGLSMGAARTREPEGSSPAEAAHANGLAARAHSDR